MHVKHDDARFFNKILLLPVFDHPHRCISVLRCNKILFHTMGKLNVAAHNRHLALRHRGINAYGNWPIPIHIHLLWICNPRILVITNFLVIVADFAISGARDQLSGRKAHTMPHASIVPKTYMWLYPHSLHAHPTTFHRSTFLSAQELRAESG